MTKQLGPTAVGEPRALPPAEPITALVVVGRGEVLRLSPAKAQFTLGSDGPPATDLTVRRAMNGEPELVSRRHAVLYRDAYRIVIHDLSRNGTFFQGRRISKEVIQAGESFHVVDVPLLAIDEQLANLREDLRLALGLSAHPTVDEALATIALGGHLLLIGPPGCDQRVLARRIHDRSPRRSNSFVEIDPHSIGAGAIASAASEAALGTAFLDLHQPGRGLSPTLIREVFERDRHVRVIVSAPSQEEAIERLGAHRARFDVIEVPSIADRRADLIALFDYLCAELPTELRLKDLAPVWDPRSLESYPWPGNLDQMREELPWPIALAQHKKVRATARVLNMPHNTLSKWIQRVGPQPPRGRR